jgi:hypothetical protein
MDILFFIFFLGGGKEIVKLNYFFNKLNYDKKNKIILSIQLRFQITDYFHNSRLVHIHY